MQLKGGINFRDLGGHRAHDGRKVKMKRVFRSGALSGLTLEDCTLLAATEVKHIIDYRDHHESAKDKNVMWDGVEYECCPANPKSHAVAATGMDFFADSNLSSLPADFMATLYENLPFNNSAYQRLFKKLETIETGALLHHCAVGKDRTGVGSALILLALNVPEATVIEDYLRTEEGLKPHRLMLIDKVEKNLSLKSQQMFRKVISAHPEFLEAALNKIHERYGKIENYFEKEFGLDTLRSIALRDKYLE